MKIKATKTLMVDGEFHPDTIAKMRKDGWNIYYLEKGCDSGNMKTPWECKGCGKKIVVSDLLANVFALPDAPLWCQECLDTHVFSGDILKQRTCSVCKKEITEEEIWVDGEYFCKECFSPDGLIKIEDGDKDHILGKTFVEAAALRFKCNKVQKYVVTRVGQQTVDLSIKKGKKLVFDKKINQDEFLEKYVCV